MVLVEGDADGAVQTIAGNLSPRGTRWADDTHTTAHSLEPPLRVMDETLMKVKPKAKGAWANVPSDKELRSKVRTSQNPLKPISDE